MLFVLLLSVVACNSDADDSGVVATDDGLPGLVVVSPTSIDFGQLYLDDDAAHSFVIENQGEGDLQVYDVQFDDDTQRAHWSLQGGLSGVLQPGDSTEVTVNIHPREIAEVTTRLTVLSDDPDNGSVTVMLEADVVGVPDVRLDPATTLDLGSVIVGDTQDGDVHIANDGTADLTIQSVRLSDGTGPFSIQVDATGATVRPQSEDGLVVVRFVPTAVGAFSDALVITTSDPIAPSVSISVTGIGYQD